MKTKDIGPGKVYKGKDWEVTAAVAEHVQPWLDSLAYRVDSLDGSIVFTGDTRACDSVTELSRGSDVMLCMCWDLQQRMDEANLTQAIAVPWTLPTWHKRRVSGDWCWCISGRSYPNMVRAIESGLPRSN